MSSRTLVLAFALTCLSSATQEPAEDDPGFPVEDLLAFDEEGERYFRMGPKPGEKRPSKGHGLLLVLPGGSGDAGFRPFVENIYRQVAPEGFLVAQLVSKRWNDNGSNIWPTKLNPYPGMEFTTEEFVCDVVDHVGKELKLDPARIYVLGWSSSGTTAYTLGMLKDSPVTGSYCAQSVFRENWLPPLSRAKGHAFFIDHSPEDAKCDFAMAEQARDELAERGATTKLVTYAGGHGWHGELFERMRTGLAFLEEHHAEPRKRKKRKR